jgi:hypothetical protein
VDCARSVRVATQKAQEGDLCEYSAEENPPVGSVKKIVAFRGKSQPTGYFRRRNEQICSRTKRDRLTVVAETVQESTGVITSRRVDAHLCLVSHHQLILPQRPAQNVMSFFNTATSTTAATLGQRHRGRRPASGFHLFPHFLPTSGLSRGWKLGQQCTCHSGVCTHKIMNASVSRSAFTKSARMDKPRERLCSHIRGQF